MANICIVDVTLQHRIQILAKILALFFIIIIIMVVVIIIIIYVTSFSLAFAPI